MNAAISELSENQQMVLRLFYKEDYSLNEMSDILEISVGTVKSRLFHAREELKTILKYWKQSKIEHDTGISSLLL